MAEVAKRFLYAWKAADLGAMKALWADDGVMVVPQTGRLGPKSFSFSRWADVSSEELCRGGVTFACQAYEIANEVVADHQCHAPTPAEAANGYGTRCRYFLDYAWRARSDLPYQDGASCIEVRMEDSVPKVTYAEDGFNCVPYMKSSNVQA
jgi:hypothetical protein